MSKNNNYSIWFFTSFIRKQSIIRICIDIFFTVTFALTLVNNYVGLELVKFLTKVSQYLCFKSDVQSKAYALYSIVSVCMSYTVIQRSLFLSFDMRGPFNRIFWST